jgi:hypothetical protein
MNSWRHRRRPASALLRAALALSLVCAGLFLATPARAVISSVRVDLPARFVFSGDVRGIVTPRGFNLGVMTDWYFGLAFERYSVAIDDPKAGIGGVQTKANYQLLDLFFQMRFTAMHVELGLGTGKVSLDSFLAGTQTISTDTGDADQFLLVLGWPLSKAWEFHIGYHEIDAKAALLVNQQPSGAKIDLSGVMHSLGFKYTF